ncbi:MAG: phosphate permease, partial [Bacteroidetes bacterium]|nr:phosphate permease [Bacteroidota bacterium]
LSRGVGALDMKMIGKIVTSWIITLPIAGAVAALVFFILRALFG